MISLNAEKRKLSKRIGHKVMGLNHFSDMTAKLPTFKIKKCWQFFILKYQSKLGLTSYFNRKEE